MQRISIFFPRGNSFDGSNFKYYKFKENTIDICTGKNKGENIFFLLNTYVNANKKQNPIKCYVMFCSLLFDSSFKTKGEWKKRNNFLKYF